MLKNCILPVQNDGFLNKTCGEIICQSETSFAIVCKFCKMKIFQFNEFLEHFLLIHWPDLRETSIICNTTENYEQREDIKTESYTEDEGEVIYEKYYLDEPKTLDSIKVEDKYQSKEPLQENDQNSLFSASEVEEYSSSDEYKPLAILRKKLKSFNTKIYKCTICSRSFGKKCYLDMHKKQKHKVLEFRCNECNRSFAKESLLKQHQYKHTGYSCEKCGKSFKQSASLRYHKDTHKEEKTFICDFESCGKAFINKRRLAAHKTVHSLKFVCEICGSRQSKKHYLIDHIRTHTGEKPFVCKLCDHRFTSKNLLSEHQACHETERKHICDVCGKSFNRQKALYHHKHLHLGIKKFVCKVCGAAYAQAAGLSAHRRKHKENNS